MTCRNCHECCIANGLIPPLLPHGAGEDAPKWMAVLVDNLRTHFADEAEDYPCVFLTKEGCAVHDVYKPQVCREFMCTPKPELEHAAVAD